MVEGTREGARLREELQTLRDELHAARLERAKLEVETEALQEEAAQLERRGTSPRRRWSTDEFMGAGWGVASPPLVPPLLAVLLPLADVAVGAGVLALTAIALILAVRRAQGRRRPHQKRGTLALVLVTVLTSPLSAVLWASANPEMILDNRADHPVSVSVDGGETVVLEPRSRIRTRRHFGDYAFEIRTPGGNVERLERRLPFGSPQLLSVAGRGCYSISTGGGRGTSGTHIVYTHTGSYLASGGGGNSYEQYEAVGRWIAVPYGTRLAGCRTR